MFLSTYNNSIWLRNRLIERARQDRGAAFIEYAFLLSLIVIVCLAAVTFLGTSTKSNTTDSATKIVAAN